MPSFDVVRVEPTGEAVIAGRAAPGSRVELLVDGEVFATATADAGGAFALLPPALPVGSHGIVLRTAGPDGAVRLSAQVVTVVVAPDPRTMPLVTVAAPGSPILVLSRPETPRRVASADPASVASGVSPSPSVADPSGAPALIPVARGLPVAATPPGVAPGRSPRPDAPPSGPAGPVGIVSVEVEGSDRVYVSGTGRPGATVRLYLNDALVATARAGPDGRIAFSIAGGVSPGGYRVRLDEVDARSGAVSTRAEVPFRMPRPVLAGVSRTGEDGPGGARQPAETRIDGSVPASPLPASIPASPPPVASDRPGSQPAAVRPVGSETAQPRAMPQRQASLAMPGRAPATRPAAVTVPRIRTAVVGRGESLWAISQRIYGDGERYSVIFGANSPQIRDPNLIYPGQVFVLPATAPSLRHGPAR